MPRLRRPSAELLVEADETLSKANAELLYFDTSFLAPLILPEATSDKVAAFVGKLSGEPCTIGRWTRVGFPR